MKNLAQYILFAMMLFTITSCSDDDKDNLEPEYMDVTYNNISGTWQLTSWNGVSQTESPYMYLVMERKDHKFSIYQNFDSNTSRHITGTYTIYLDKNDQYCIKGIYDHASGFWSNNYFVTKLGKAEMTWSVIDNDQDISVFSRVDAVPEDIVNGIKSSQIE